MICSACTEEKPLDDFHRDGRTKSGFSSVCERCFQSSVRQRHRDDKRRYRQDRPRAVKASYRDWFLRTKYGISLAEFDRMLEGQGGRCAGCRAADSGWAKGWHLDHDHGCCPTTPTCGKCNRGILCQSCNLTLGHAKDNPEVLLALAAYLKGPNYQEPDLASIVLGALADD